MPRVSVIVPSFNHAPYLTWRIDTILGQTFSDLELLILDDCSTDHSRRIIEKYRGRPRVSIHLNAANSGSVFRQWEKGLSLAAGEYVWIAESDDWAAPTFLERLVPILDGNPNVGLAYCQSWIVDRKFKVCGNAICWTEDLDPRRWQSDFCARGREEIRRFLLAKNTIPNASAVLMRRSVVDQVRPIESCFRLCGDWLHWIRMLAISDIAFVSESLNFWRSQSSNARSAPPGVLEWEEGERVLGRGADLLGLSDAERDRVLLAFLRRCWRWLADHARTAAESEGG